MSAAKHYSGKRLRELREQRGFSREQIATGIRRSWNAAYQYERGELIPGRQAQEALSQLLDVPTDDFYIEVVGA
jgi:transcriptional regulator with XRE-family HTH domain